MYHRNTISFNWFFGVQGKVLHFPGGVSGKEPGCQCRRHNRHYMRFQPSSIPMLERVLGGGNGNLLQYSSLANPMNRGSWWAIVHGVTKSQTHWNDLACTQGKGTKSVVKQTAKHPLNIKIFFFFLEPAFGFEENSSLSSHLKRRKSLESLN